ncbi:MAG: hypothetical protein LBL49_06280 [Clostridiales Family XIII bacterium]|nr:hypothetical protein [Clostridiales Family XIII bacterium]
MRRVLSADNYFWSENNYTTYIKGDLKILMKLEHQPGPLLGPVMDNLRIIKEGVETRPNGYFGYYQEKEPLFSVSEGYIYTTQVIAPDNQPDYFTAIDNYEARIPKPCRVSIDTGQVFEINFSD